MAETKVTGPDLVEEGIPDSDLALDVPVKGQVDGRPVIVVRTATGICAVAGSCTHYGDLSVTACAWTGRSAALGITPDSTSPPARLSGPRRSIPSMCTGPKRGRGGSTYRARSTPLPPSALHRIHRRRS